MKIKQNLINFEKFGQSAKLYNCKQETKKLYENKMKTAKLL